MALVDEHRQRLLARARVPGRIRDTALSAWRAAKADPHRARAIFGAALRDARALHSAERRLVQEALYRWIREERGLYALLGTDDPERGWLGLLVRLGMDPEDDPGLRAVAEGWDRLGDGLPPVARLALRHSVPEAVVTRLVAVLGADEAEAFLVASDARAPVAVRANRLRCTPEKLARRLAAEGVATRPSTRAKDGLVVDGRPHLPSLPSFRDGWLEVMDEGSQRVAEKVEPDGPVIDVCAGAGGKTLALAGAGVPVLALDVREGALIELRKRAARAGAKVTTRRIPETGPLPADLRPASRVLVDAPCSGTGVLRRHPEHRWQLDDAAVRAQAARQAEILDRAAALVAPGGRLIYATCSVLPDEDEDVVRGFLAAHPGFRLREEERSWPHRDDTDGFYVAVLER